MNGLEEARMVRKRKDKAGLLIYEACQSLGNVLFLHPNDLPIYLDWQEVHTLRRVQEQIKEILKRHTKDLERLEQE